MERSQRRDVAVIDFKPGDIIVKDGVRVTKRYTVADPPYSARGKLRLITASGTIMTTWWKHPATGYILPAHYRLEIPDE
jgi:hypothetical protein